MFVAKKNPRMSTGGKKPAKPLAHNNKRGAAGRKDTNPKKHKSRTKGLRSEEPSDTPGSTQKTAITINSSDDDDDVDDDTEEMPKSKGGGITSKEKCTDDMARPLLNLYFPFDAVRVHTVPKEK